VQSPMAGWPAEIVTIESRSLDKLSVGRIWSVVQIIEGGHVPTAYVTRLPRHPTDSTRTANMLRDIFCGHAHPVARPRIPIGHGWLRYVMGATRRVQANQYTQWMQLDECDWPVLRCACKWTNTTHGCNLTPRTGRVEARRYTLNIRGARQSFRPIAFRVGLDRAAQQVDGAA